MSLDAAIKAEQERRKFLVSWIEDSGFARGQAVKTREEADRMFKHVTEGVPPPLFCEVRKIGSQVLHYSRGIKQ